MVPHVALEVRGRRAVDRRVNDRAELVQEARDELVIADAVLAEPPQ
jgi:hypothetical protein